MAFRGIKWAGLWRTARRFTSSFVEHNKAEEEHALKTMKTWKNISLFVAIPAMGLVAYNSYRAEKEHVAHEHEHGRPPFIPYTHLRIRSKPFPWKDGNHSLFHNSHTNALPEGYEDHHGDH